jgi:O-antigen/teichoic acid export membrane protein
VGQADDAEAIGCGSCWQIKLFFTLTGKAVLMTFSRRLVSGTTQLTLSNAVVRMLSIFSMPILTSRLNPQAYGVVALVGTAISLASVFALAGIDMSYARAYHSNRPPSGAAVEHYCWRFALSASLIVGMPIAMVWWFLNRNPAEVDGSLVFLLTAGVILSIMHTMAQTRARLAGRYRSMSIAIIASGLTGTVASIGIALIWRQDAMALLVPMFIGYLLPILLLGTPSMARLLRPSSLNRTDGLTLVKIGLAGIVTAPMFWVLSSSDRWFLQYYYGADTVGIYSVGYSVAILGMMVNGAVMAVWLPEAAREYEQGPEQARDTLGWLMSRLVVLMALIWLMVVASGGDIIRWMANERFHAASEYVPYIAGGVFFYGISQLAFTGLMLVKQLKWTALWWLLGGPICVLLNLVLVPKYGGKGAAMTQSLSFAFISLGILATSQTMFRIALDWTRLAPTLMIVLLAGVLLAPSWSQIPFVSLLLKLPIGLAVSVIGAWLIAPDWCSKATAYLQRRMWHY